MVDDYEYRGLMAESWDLLRGDPSGRFDRDFYWAMIHRYGEPVLDAGCGTGRLLLDFLSTGVEIDGVDLSPEMLAICRCKGQALGLTPTLYEQPLENLRLPRRYRTILASSSVLQLLPDPVIANRAVTSLYEHLLPGGVILAPFMMLWRPGMPLQREWENAALRASDGATLTRMGRLWYDPASACEHTEDLYQVLIDGEIVAAEHHRRSPAARSYTQAQARQLFTNAGFDAVDLYRGFSQQPASGEEMLFLVIASKSTGLPSSQFQLIPDPT
jgi:SAM-dependent methyltransferase